jgi:hypothetical protein
MDGVALIVARFQSMRQVPRWLLTSGLGDRYGGGAEGGLPASGIELATRAYAASIGSYQKRIYPFFRDLTSITDREIFKEKADKS